jgi:hypothetical protein
MAESWLSALLLPPPLVTDATAPFRVTLSIVAIVPLSKASWALSVRSNAPVSVLGAAEWTTSEACAEPVLPLMKMLPELASPAAVIESLALILFDAVPIWTSPPLLTVSVPVSVRLAPP